MSAILMIAPASSINATERGTRVFFIHMQWSAFSSNTKTMPALVGRDSRYMSPCMRLPALSANSAWMRCIPVESSTTGNCWAPARSASSAKVRRSAARMAEKEKAGSEPCLLSSIGEELLLVAALLVHLLVGLLAALLVALLLHLVFPAPGVGRSDGVYAHDREHGGHNHRQQLDHLSLLVLVCKRGDATSCRPAPRRRTRGATNG